MLFYKSCSFRMRNALDSLDLFRTLHEKRLDEVAWKWLEHRNSGELFEKYLEQTSQGNIPDLKTQIAKMLGIQEKKQDEKIFTSIFEKCIRLISYSYIRALDIQEIVTTLVFYIHLQLLKENKVADTVLIQIIRQRIMFLKLCCMVQMVFLHTDLKLNLHRQLLKELIICSLMMDI